jgi:hypothetical protein
MLFTSLTLLFLGIACNDTSPEKSPPKEIPVAKEPSKKFTLDLKNLDQKLIQEIALVPSPAEMQKALSKAGLQSKLGELASKSAGISMETDNQDQLAVRCGVVLAELALTVQTASNDKIIENLALLKQGFTKLKAGPKFLKTIDELSSSVQTGAKSRDDLLKEMDQLAGIMVPELKKELGDWVVPLVQAGSWLKGANLVASAIESESKYDAATRLLKQPHVIEYFLKYVQREGKSKAPDEVIKKLETTLLELKRLSAKSSLEKEDVLLIKTNTHNVLQFL